MTVVIGKVLLLQAHVKFCALKGLVGILSSYVRLVQF